MEVETGNILIGRQLVWDIPLISVSELTLGISNSGNNCKICRAINTSCTTYRRLFY